MTDCWFWRAIGILLILTNAVVAQEQNANRFFFETPLDSWEMARVLSKCAQAVLLSLRAQMRWDEFRLIMDGKPYECKPTTQVHRSFREGSPIVWP